MVGVRVGKLIKQRRGLMRWDGEVNGESIPSSGAKGHIFAWHSLAPLAVGNSLNMLYPAANFIT